MKSTSKANGARLQRGARSTAPLRGVGKQERSFAERFSDPHWDGLDEEIDLDLDNLDLDDVDGDDSSSGDWLADRDFALAIARGALH